MSADDYRCCTLDEGHDGLCVWLCSDCNGSGRCLVCETECYCDDVVQCERAAWQHDTGAHADSEHPYLDCPRCEMEHPEGMLADAHAVIRRYEAGWHSTKHVEGLWAKDSLRFEQWEPMTPGEVDAIRRARSVPATETGETP